MVMKLVQENKSQGTSQIQSFALRNNFMSKPKAKHINLWQEANVNLNGKGYEEKAVTKGKVRIGDK